MKMPWTAAIESVSSLVSEFVEDPDKKNQIMYQISELDHKLTTTLLTSKTTPKTDALVKLMIAVKDVLIPMLRPLGAAAMTGFGMYCHLKGIDIDGASQIMLDGAFPAWGVSRHSHKAKEAELKAQEQSDLEYWEEEDANN
jgi:hypothetical protein